MSQPDALDRHKSRTRDELGSGRSSSNDNPIISDDGSYRASRASASPPRRAMISSRTGGQLDLATSEAGYNNSGEKTFSTVDSVERRLEDMIGDDCGRACPGEARDACARTDNPLVASLSDLALTNPDETANEGDCRLNLNTAEMKAITRSGSNNSHAQRGQGDLTSPIEQGGQPPSSHSRHPPSSYDSGIRSEVSDRAKSIRSNKSTQPSYSDARSYNLSDYSPTRRFNILTKKNYSVDDKKNCRGETSGKADVCDCLSQTCQEKEHSNRRQFIEHYYHSRTRLPSSSQNSASTLTIDTPLNRLSECDAITKRLLSSPVRSGSFLVGDKRIHNDDGQSDQANESSRSRSGSLRTESLTNQLSYSGRSHETLNLCDSDRTRERASVDSYGKLSRVASVSPTSENNVKLKNHEGRSLSVCHEESQNYRFRDNVAIRASNDHGSVYSRKLQHSQHHSSNLNRAISVTCDSSSSKRFLTIIPLFGCEITALDQLIKFGLTLPPPIDSAIDHILANGKRSIGIFRKSGQKSRILTLRQRIESNQDLRLEDINSENEFSIYDIADLVKMWFRELKPAPIMTRDLIKSISDHITYYACVQDPSHPCESEGSQASKYSSSQRAISQTKMLSNRLRKELVSTISPTHRALLSKTLGFFSTIASYSETNQMTSQNLAICLTPSLCATGSDQESIITAQRALKFCLDNHQILF